MEAVGLVCGLLLLAVSVYGFVRLPAYPAAADDGRVPMIEHEN
jgi:hypothetical protein